MDKPVHKVLEDYDLLNVSCSLHYIAPDLLTIYLQVSVIQSSNTINMTAAMLWVTRKQ